VAYTQVVNDVFAGWQAGNIARLQGVAVGSRPKPLIAALSEDLLLAFAQVKLIDKYDVYQHLMSYWTDTMQDDVYMITSDGWQANGDLIPPQLIIARYFAAEQQAIEALEAEKEAIGRQMEEMDEGHGGEGGLLEEVKTDKGKITKANVKARLQDIQADPDAADERQVLYAYFILMEQESHTGKRVKDAQKALEAKVAARYKALSEDEVKTLVVDDKWLAALAAGVQTELERISQALTGRIQELVERYATPLPQLDSEVDVLNARVDAHLERMGFVWN
jgi:type I restriction enzyme M protein